MKRKKNLFMKFAVTVSILILLSYTAISLYFASIGIYVPDALTYSVFGAFAFELGVAGGIKIGDTKGRH